MLEDDAYRYVTLVFDERHVFVNDDEPSRYVRNFAGRIVVVDDNEGDVVVGWFETTCIDLIGPVRDRSWPMLDIFDQSQATYDVYAALFKDDEPTRAVRRLLDDELGFIGPDSVLIIDRLEILSQHQGKRLGITALRSLMLDHCQGTLLIVLKPFPLQFEPAPPPEDPGYERRLALGLDTFDSNERRATARLMRLYAQLGFKKVPRTKYMVRSNLRPAPRLDELGDPAA